MSLFSDPTEGVAAWMGVGESSEGRTVEILVLALVRTSVGDCSCEILLKVWSLLKYNKVDGTQNDA